MSALTMDHVRPTAVPPISREQFARLVAQHQAAVCAVAYSTLGNRAVSEEIAQEAFFLAWRKLPDLDEPPTLPAWFCGIARNLARNARRGARRSVGSEALDTAQASNASPLDEVIQAQDQRLVWHALEALPETYREPLVLFYRTDQSIRKVAAALDISEATARQRLSRGRSQLEQQLRGVVEHALQRGGPGAAFTAAVVASLASVPAVTRAAPTTGTASVTLATRYAHKLTFLGAAAAVSLAFAATVLYVGNRAAPPLTSLRQRPGQVAATVAPNEPVSAAPSRLASGAPGPRYRPLTAAMATGSSAVGAGAPRSAAQTLPVDALSQHLREQLAKKIDLDLRQASVDNVLQLLGEVSNIDIVVRGDIASNASFNMRATTVQEALDETLAQAAAVWREVSIVRVVDGAGPTGPWIEGPAISLDLTDAELATVMHTFEDVLQMPVVIAKGVQAPPVTTRVVATPAAVALAQIVRAAGLRYEVVPAIEVRPEEDVAADPR